MGRAKSRDIADQYESALNRLTRTFAAQIEALKRYRSKGEQRVYVERVNVGEGGQAIVGLVGEGGGSVKKERVNPLDRANEAPRYTPATVWLALSVTAPVDVRTGVAMRAKPSANMPSLHRFGVAGLPSLVDSRFGPQARFPLFAALRSIASAADFLAKPSGESAIIDPIADIPFPCVNLWTCGPAANGSGLDFWRDFRFQSPQVA